MYNFRKKSGITLIALIITIIVMLMLAGTSISLVVGDNGVLTQTKKAVDVIQELSAVEEVEIAYSAVLSAYYDGYGSNASIDKWDFIDQTKLGIELMGTGSIVENTFSKNNVTKEIKFTYNSNGKNTNYDITITADDKVIGEPSVLVEPPVEQPTNNNL